MKYQVYYEKNACLQYESQNKKVELPCSVSWEQVCQAVKIFLILHRSINESRSAICINYGVTNKL